MQKLITVVATLILLLPLILCETDAATGDSCLDIGTTPFYLQLRSDNETKHAAEYFGGVIFGSPASSPSTFHIYDSLLVLGARATGQQTNYAKVITDGSSSASGGPGSVLFHPYETSKAINCHIARNCELLCNVTFTNYNYTDLVLGFRPTHKETVTSLWIEPADPTNPVSTATVVAMTIQTTTPAPSNL